MHKIIVLTQGRRGRYSAATVGFPAVYTRRTYTAALRDAKRIASHHLTEGHSAEIRDFVAGTRAAESDPEEGQPC